MESSYSVFVHLLGPGDVLVAQHDGVPAGSAIPTDTWLVGEVVPDHHIVEFSTLSPGEYRLVVGMYDPATGERLLSSEGKTTILLERITIN
jgi:hypothetical protein